jgi:hypothetical protein
MSNRIEAARESLANRHRETKVTAPLLDSTRLKTRIVVETPPTRLASALEGN